MRIFTALWRWLNVLPRPLAEDAVRAEWAKYLQESPDAKVDTPQVTELLLREVKYTVDTKLATIRATEGKAIAQVGLLGGGLGIISVLGASQSPLVIPGNLWLLTAACTILVIAAAADAACIARGYTEFLPQLDIFNSQAVVGDGRMKARVGMSITEGYATYSSELTALSVSKARLLRVATFALVLGVLLLVANAVWVDMQPYHSARSTANAKCRIAATTITCEVKH